MWRKCYTQVNKTPLSFITHQCFKQLTANPSSDIHP